MRGYLWFWVVWLLVGAGFEVWAVWFRPAQDDTLSELAATLFRTGTTAGWFALMILMGFLAAWFPGHTRRLAQRRAEARILVLGDRLDTTKPAPKFVYVEDDRDADDKP